VQKGSRSGHDAKFGGRDITSINGHKLEKRSLKARTDWLREDRLGTRQGGEYTGRKDPKADAKKSGDQN